MKVGDATPNWWLGGTTCRHYKNTVAWMSDCGKFALFRHSGHSEWCGSFSGNAYCRTLYALFPSNAKHGDSDVFGTKGTLLHWEGKLTKARILEIEKITT